MADKHPIKAVFTNTDATGFQEFESTDTLGIAHGGTGSTTAAGARTNLLELSAAPSADTWDGITISLTAHETMALGKVCFINSDGEAALADADSSSMVPALYMATAATSANATGLFLRSGVIHLHTLNPALTVGGLVYVSGTAGGITKDRPATTGMQVQIIGVALAADILDFNPSPVVVQVA